MGSTSAAPEVATWVSEELQELLVGQGGLFNDGLQGPAFKVLVVKRDSDAECRLFRVFEDTVTSCTVMNKEARPLQDAKNFLRLQSRKTGGHTGSRATLISSLTGSRGSFLSGGIGSPSLRKLSR